MLYDASVGPDAALEPLSLVMKGEQLPARTRWRGIPARGVVEPRPEPEPEPDLEPEPATVRLPVAPRDRLLPAPRSSGPDAATTWLPRPTPRDARGRDPRRVA